MREKYIIDKSKYKILSNGTIVYRVQAMQDIRTKSGDVYAGEYGGFVESERNLSQTRTCWLFGDTVVSGEARVQGEAIALDCEINGRSTICDRCLVANSYITDNAVISGIASVLDSVVSGNAVVSGPTRLYKSHISGNACVFEKEFLEQVAIEDCVGSFTKRESNATRRYTHKYTLVPLSGEYEGLFRLRANSEFINFLGQNTPKIIRSGEFGGIVSGVQNLSKYGSCWIDYDSKVLGDASVHDYAFITGESVVSGNAVVCGSAYVDNCIIEGNAYTAGHAKLNNIILRGNSRVFGASRVGKKDIEESGEFLGKLAFDDLFLVSESESIKLKETLKAQNFN